MIAKNGQRLSTIEVYKLLLGMNEKVSGKGNENIER